VPIIVKETGNGISGETAREPTAAGVDAIDVAGKARTTWSGIEAYRAAAANAPRQKRIGTLFRNGASQPLQARLSVLPNTTA